MLKVIPGTHIIQQHNALCTVVGKAHVVDTQQTTCAVMYATGFILPNWLFWCTLFKPLYFGLLEPVESFNLHAVSNVHNLLLPHIHHRTCQFSTRKAHSCLLRLMPGRECVQGFSIIRACIGQQSDQQSILYTYVFTLGGVKLSWFLWISSHLQKIHPAKSQTRLQLAQLRACNCENKNAKFAKTCDR